MKKFIVFHLLTFAVAHADVTLTNSVCKYKYADKKIEATCTAAETSHVCVATGSMIGGMNFAQQIVSARCRAELAQKVEAAGNSQGTTQQTPRPQQLPQEIKTEELTEKEKEDKKEFKIFKEAYEFCKLEATDYTDEQCMAFGMKAVSESKKPKNDCSTLVGKESGECDGSRWERVDENNLSRAVNSSDRGMPPKDMSSQVGEQRSGSASRK